MQSAEKIIKDRNSQITSLLQNDKVAQMQWKNI